MTNRNSAAYTQHHWLPASGIPNLMPVVRAIATLGILSGLVQASWADSVTVQITKRWTRNPVQDATVCLGTLANSAQFGVRLTDVKGTVQFAKLPPTNLVLTVSKSGFKGRQIALGRAQRDRELLLTLPAGGGGPQCVEAVSVTRSVSVTQPGSTGFIASITDFRIDGGQTTTPSRTVTLTYALTGNATHYRASERSNFETAKWQLLEPEVRYDLTGGSGLKTVYFQVTKFTSVEGAEIRSLSDVAVDTILLTGG